MILVLVAQVRNTNNVVEDRLKPVNTGFFNAPKTSEYNLDTFLDTFRWVFKRYLDTLFLKQKYKKIVLLKNVIIPLFIKDCKDLIKKKRWNFVHFQIDMGKWVSTYDIINIRGGLLWLKKYQLRYQQLL